MVQMSLPLLHLLLVRAMSHERTREFIDHVRTSYPAGDGEDAWTRKRVADFINKWEKEFDARPVFTRPGRPLLQFPQPASVTFRLGGGQGRKTSSSKTPTTKSKRTHETRLPSIDEEREQAPTAVQFDENVDVIRAAWDVTHASDAVIHGAAGTTP